MQHTFLLLPPNAQLITFLSCCDITHTGVVMFRTLVTCGLDVGVCIIRQMIDIIGEKIFKVKFARRNFPITF